MAYAERKRKHIRQDDNKRRCGKRKTTPGTDSQGYIFCEKFV